MFSQRVRCGLFLLAVACALAGPSRVAAQKKDYLTNLEADKIRDAETSSERIKLFLSFAADRLKKVQYELSRATQDRHRSERVNGLLNEYSGCVDEAAELIELGREKQEDIRDGIKEMQKKGKEFLAYFEPLAASGPAVEPYKDTLDDAIEATKDALRDAEKAAKEYTPPPVRRKP